MFPTDITFPKVITDTENDSADASVGRSFVFDYVKGQHLIVDGKPKETDESTAIKQWFELLLRTTLGKYTVYDDTDFGTTWQNYIGYRQLPKGFVESELKREIVEACDEYCPAVAAVTDFVAERTSHGLTVSFTAELTNSELVEVTISV